MRDGRRFCSVAAVLDGCHGRLKALARAPASQCGHRDKERRNMAKMMYHMLLCQKKLEVVRSRPTFLSRRGYPVSDGGCWGNCYPKLPHRPQKHCTRWTQHPPSSSHIIHSTPPTSLPHIRSERLRNLIHTRLRLLSRHSLARACLPARQDQPNGASAHSAFSPTHLAFHRHRRLRSLLISWILYAGPDSPSLY